jgi:hypothetical protein
VKITRWTDGGTIWEGEAETILDALLKAIKAQATLHGAYLSEATLHGAYLSGANLSGADLSEANLSEAYLSGANLSRANLSEANLSEADLSGAYLSGANLSGAYLSGANLSGANLSGANLSGANLSGANLSGADLSRANLSEANLSEAYLSGANLSRANLHGATGITPERCTPLLMLLDQPGAIRAYKLVTAAGVGPFNGGITYKVGKSYEVKDAETDPTEQCAAGINLATLDWCLMNWQKGWRVLIAEFTAADIACIPTATDGKFRVHRCRIVGEKDIAGLVGGGEHGDPA